MIGMTMTMTMSLTTKTETTKTKIKIRIRIKTNQTRPPSTTTTTYTSRTMILCSMRKQQPGQHQLQQLRRLYSTKRRQHRVLLRILISTLLHSSLSLGYWQLLWAGQSLGFFVPFFLLCSLCTGNYTQGSPSILLKTIFSTGKGDYNRRQIEWLSIERVTWPISGDISSKTKTRPSCITEC